VIILRGTFIRNLNKDEIELHCNASALEFGALLLQRKNYKK